MSLAFSYRGALVIILDEENMERIQQNDPFEVNLARSPVLMALTFPLKVQIVYAKKEELSKIQAMSAFPTELMRYLCRGFKITDTDKARGNPYIALEPTTRRGD